MVHDLHHSLEVRSPSYFEVAILKENADGCCVLCRTKFRKQANEADNKGATRAVDALINFEAVKVRSLPLRRLFIVIILDLTRLALIFQHFGNEKYEVAQYDKTLQSYEASSVKIATSLAYLNSGQNIIFSSALTLMMALAAQGIMKGAF